MVRVHNASQTKDMKIHFINHDTKEDLTQEDVIEVLKQINEGRDYVAVYDGDKIKFACKVSQINYID